MSPNRAAIISQELSKARRGHHHLLCILCSSLTALRGHLVNLQLSTRPNCASWTTKINCDPPAKQTPAAQHTPSHLSPPRPGSLGRDLSLQPTRTRLIHPLHERQPAGRFTSHTSPPAHCARVLSTGIQQAWQLCNEPARAMAPPKSLYESRTSRPTRTSSFSSPT